jgi:hypothetical protein
MPRRNSLISRLRHGRAWDEWDDGWDGGEEVAAATKVVSEARAAKPRSRRRRLLATTTFATLFVAGAAFSAGAGNQVRSMLESQAAGSAVGVEEGTTTEETAPASTEPAPPADPSGSEEAAPPQAPADAEAPAAPAEAAPEAAPPPPAASVPQSAPVTAAAKAAVQKAAQRSGAVARAGHRARSGRRSSQRRPTMLTMRVKTHRHAFPKREMVKAAPPDLDGASPGAATVWLNRALPDPTPPALRLKPSFARHLLSVSRARHVGWALMLGVLRAEGHNGSAPANLAGLKGLAARLGSMRVRSGSPWAAMFSLAGDTSVADRTVALSHFYRAVGLRALVRGLVADKANLAKKVLDDPRVSIYPGGRGDIQAGRVNVRVLATIEYLADTFGQVTVSCLISGHGLYARPGVVSAHIYGLAADISALGGTSITGHQQAGGVTERAVRQLLLLPPEMMPKQVISLLGLGGPSFPLANHWDHVHIGY